MNVTAPYNFVPLCQKVCTATDLGLPDLPSQDAPETDGLSGSIVFSLKCTTPLLIGDSGGDETRFLRDPNNNDIPIIPGSSLRGMLRNVIEIASFARFSSFVDDHRVGVRDLSPSAREDYGSRLNDIKAGWLQIECNNENPKLVLKKCNFARILHTELDKISSGFSNQINTLAAKKDANDRGAEQVEAAFGQNMDIQFSLDGDDAIIDTKGNSGKLVFTGLPGTKIVNDSKVSSKRREFVFFCDEGNAALPDGVWEKFIAVHEKQEKPNKTWEWRRKKLHGGTPMPVFWLPAANGDIAQIGLAMMFKIAVDNSIHDLIPPAHKTDAIDLPTRIFGRVHDKDSFKTRVSFGFARLTSKFIETEYKLISAKPKPGFVPSYIRQKDFGKADGTKLHSNAQYRSYMNWNSRKEELRGWKRYPAQGTNSPAPQEGSGGSSSALLPISNEDSLIFTGRIRFHNLHPVELGALLWALTWGGNKELRHGLGMGKPFGWGQVAFDLKSVSHAYGAPKNDPLQSFTKAMEAWTNGVWAGGSGWTKSPQIRQLLAMADPALGAKRQETHLRQMVLDPQKNTNQFKSAKDNRAVLPEYLPDGETPNFAIAKNDPVKGGVQQQTRNQSQNRNKRAAPPAKTKLATLDDEQVKVLNDDGQEASVQFDSGDIDTVNSSELKYLS